MIKALTIAQVRDVSAMADACRVRSAFDDPDDASPDQPTARRPA